MKKLSALALALMLAPQQTNTLTLNEVIEIGGPSVLAGAILGLAIGLWQTEQATAVLVEQHKHRAGVLALALRNDTTRERIGAQCKERQVLSSLRYSIYESTSHKAVLESAHTELKTMLPFLRKNAEEGALQNNFYLEAVAMLQAIDNDLVLARN